MEVKVTFIFEKRTIEVQCIQNEEIKTIYGKFINKLNPKLNINDFDFFYETIKLSKDIKSLNDFV